MTDTSGQQPDSAPEPEMVTTTAEQRRVRLIVTAIVSVVVIIIGVIVIISVTGDDGATDGSPASSVTTPEGGTSAATTSPARTGEPCDDINLEIDLGIEDASAVMCDGAWAVAEDTEGNTTIARWADTEWVRGVDTSTTAACRTEVLNAGVPVAAVDAAAWSCELTTKPATWTPEDRTGPLESGMSGSRVAAIQYALATYDWMPFGSMDGFLGPETLQALVKFQLWNGLEITGVVDDVTSEAIYGSYVRTEVPQPILLQPTAISDIYLGSSTAGTVDAVTKLLGLPDDYQVGEFSDGNLQCPGIRIVSWSNLTLVFNGSFSGYIYSYSPTGTVELATRDGRTVGVPWETTGREPKVTTSEFGTVFLSWPDGYFGLGTNDGLIDSFLGGDLTCLPEIE